MALTSDMKKITDPFKPNRTDETSQPEATASFVANHTSSSRLSSENAEKPVSGGDASTHVGSGTELDPTLSTSAKANILPRPKATRKVSSRTSAVSRQAVDEPSTDGANDGANGGADQSLDAVEEMVLDTVSNDRATSFSTASVDHLSPVINDSQSAKYFTNPAPNSQSPYSSMNPSIGQSSDRIAIFIDGSNLFYAASHLNIEVDYRRLLTTLVRGRRLLRAYFYTGVDPQNEKQRGFLLWLNRHGHRVVSKELAQLPDGSRKANMHVEMAVDMMRIAEYCSTLTLLGGDGNLAYALQMLSQRGTSIEVVSLQSMTSDSLIDLADAYTDLADLRDEIKR